ncbi:MAG: hypothetical protein WCU88_10555 [Elusimicrobiota bacterium]|jgi:hypothetical protein
MRGTQIKTSFQAAMRARCFFAAALFFAAPALLAAEVHVAAIDPGAIIVPLSPAAGQAIPAPLAPLQGVASLDSPADFPTIAAGAVRSSPVAGSVAAPVRSSGLLGRFLSILHPFQSTISMQAQAPNPETVLQAEMQKPGAVVQTQELPVEQQVPAAIDAPSSEELETIFTGARVRSDPTPAPEAAQDEPLISVDEHSPAFGLFRYLRNIEDPQLKVDKRIDALNAGEASQLIDKLRAEDPDFLAGMQKTVLADYPAYRTDGHRDVAEISLIERAVLRGYAGATGRDLFGRKNPISFAAALARDNRSFSLWLQSREVPADWDKTLESVAERLLREWASEVERRNTPEPAGDPAAGIVDIPVTDNVNGFHHDPAIEAKLEALSGEEVYRLFDQLYAEDPAFRGQVRTSSVGNYPDNRKDARWAKINVITERAVIYCYVMDTGKDPFKRRDASVPFVERPLLDPEYERKLTFASIGEAQYVGSRDGKDWLKVSGSAGSPQRLPRWTGDEGEFLERMQRVRLGRGAAAEGPRPKTPKSYRPAVLREQSPASNTVNGMQIYKDGSFRYADDAILPRFIADRAFGYHVTQAGRLKGILTKGWLPGQEPTNLTESARSPGLHLSTHLGVTYSIPGRTVILRIAMDPGEFKPIRLSAYYGHVVKENGVSANNLAQRLQFSPDGGVSWYPLTWSMADLYEEGLLPVKRAVPVY